MHRPALRRHDDLERHVAHADSSQSSPTKDQKVPAGIELRHFPHDDGREPETVESQRRLLKRRCRGPRQLMRVQPEERRATECAQERELAQWWQALVEWSQTVVVLVLPGANDMSRRLIQPRLPVELSAPPMVAGSSPRLD